MCIFAGGFQVLKKFFLIKQEILGKEIPWQVRAVEAGVSCF